MKVIMMYVLLLSFTLGPFLSLSGVAYADEEDDDWIYNPETNVCAIEPEKEKAAATSKKDEAISGTSDGNWLKSGTKSYKLAKGVFDTFTEEFGTSGAFAAGVIANVARESNFDPAVVEYENGQNYSGRGYGLYQFTPGSKYINSSEAGDKPEDSGNQTEYVWNSEFKNRAVEMFIDGSAGSSAGILYYGDKPFKDLEELLSVDDPTRGAEGFHDGYERGDLGLWHQKHGMTDEYAKKANDVFNKDDIKADKDKLKENLKGGKSGKTNVDTSDDKSKKDKDDSSNICKKPKKKSGGKVGAGWGEDGTGDHKGIKAGSGFEVGWMPDKLPKSLEKYALDPKRVDLGWKTSKNWKGSGKSTNGQCVNLSTSMFGLLWTKDGKTPSFDKASQVPGNGDHTAQGIADLYGVKTTKKPSKGAVFSAPPNSKQGPSQYGHTGMVSHVFENGDVLILEQNVGPIKGGGSGDDGGPGNPMTWNYRLINKSAAETLTYVTMDGKSGWKVNKKMKE